MPPAWWYNQATWDSGPRCRKELTYGTANGTGDWRLGKLEVAKRYKPCSAMVPRTVTWTCTHGFLTGVTGNASPISYHPNCQVNQVTRSTGVVDTYYKDPQTQLRPNKIDAKLGTTVVWYSGALTYAGFGASPSPGPGPIWATRPRSTIRSAPTRAARRPRAGSSP